MTTEDDHNRIPPHGDPLGLEPLGPVDPRGTDPLPTLEPPYAETPIDRYLMSYNGEPRGGVVKDFAFNRKSFDGGRIRNPAEGEILAGLDGIEVELVQDFDDRELQRFFSFAINATRGIDPRNPPDEADWEEMMRGGLQTALKRINIAFAVYGASRTATHQLVRSTRANFHQQSQRAHYYGDRPSVRMPESFLGKEVVPGGGRIGERDAIGHAEPLSIAEEYRKLVEHSSWFYRLATEADVSYQDARFGLLEGTVNFILCEYSLDEFIAVYAYRGCSMFQWEIVGVMRKMRAVLVDAHPWLDRYVKISCEKTAGALDAKPGDSLARTAHACTFQGWEEVEGQCGFPWARETNRTFRSERHAIGRGKS
jgi:thymidylate synthase ThyX